MVFNISSLLIKKIEKIVKPIIKKILVNMLSTSKDFFMTSKKED